MLRSLDGIGRPSSWRPSAAVALAERRGRPGYDNGSAPPIQRLADRYLLVTARLDDPAGVKAALEVEGSPDDRTLAAAAAARWGAAAASERLYGDFAIAEWDEAARRLTLARDALGARPIYYVVQPDLILFATTLQTLLALPETPRDLDEITLAHTLTIAMQDQEQTVYRHIRRAPPGGTVTFVDGQVQVRRWFTLETLKPVRFPRDDDYVDCARELLDKAVAARLSRTGRNAVFLSGGFDSAGVAATAARLLGDTRLPAFTRGAGGDHPYTEFDETGLAGLVAQRYPNIDWTVVDDDRESPRDTNPEVEAGALCVPRTGSFNGTWFESLHLAIEAHGIDVILGGGAGNSVLSWHGGPEFAKQLRTLNLPALASDLRKLARQRGRSVFPTAASVAWHSLAPRALKRWRAGDKPWLSHSLISPSFLDEIDYARHGAAADHDVPFQPRASSRELRLRSLQSQRTRDMLALARRRWRVSSRDPYADRALVEFALAIPEDQYWRKGTSRWLARRVLADRVPAEILSQERRGKQSPEWYYLATRRLDGTREAIERLSRSKLASRVLDIPRMRTLVEQWPSDAEAARAHEMLHGHALHRAIAMGGFLRWFEGGNE